MASTTLRHVRLDPAVSTTIRCVHTTRSLSGKNIRSGVPKITTNRSRRLTYEESQKPSLIGVTKYWNSINTSGLYIDKAYEKFLPRSSETAVEDTYIRKFIVGTYQQFLITEPIIKRRANMIILAFIVRRTGNPKQFYFLRGYSETILSKVLKCPVKIELQTVQDDRLLTFKQI